MLNLKEFYFEKILATDLNDRYVTIKEIDNVLIINFDCIYERTCGLRGVDQTLYLAHKLGHDKRFIFLSEDGAVLKQSGAIEFIKNIIECFNLNKDTCLIVSREDLSLENSSFVKYEAIPYWCRTLYPYVKNISIPTGPFSKKFSCWFHRGTFYRLQLAKHLYNNYKDESLISYQEPGVIVDRKLREYFKDHLDWAENHTPIIFDQLFPNRIFNLDLVVGNRKPYNEYFIEIVAETDILTTNWITEKTVKNLYIGKPFLLMCGYKSLEKIRNFGFRTFSPWIDETYDTEPNIYLRLEAIKREIDRLATIPIQQLTVMHKEILPILEHNRNIYETHINSGR